MTARHLSIALGLLGPLAAACAGPPEAPATANPDPEPATDTPDTSSGEAAKDNSREHFDFDPLPATSITGTDANHDHIRDDVEAYIDDRFADHEWRRLAARQYAREMQHALHYAHDEQRAVDALDGRFRAIQCMRASMGDRKREELAEIKARTIDNEERLQAFSAFRSHAGGAYLELLPDPADGCAFDTEGLEP